MNTPLLFDGNGITVTDDTLLGGLACGPCASDWPVLSLALPPVWPARRWQWALRVPRVVGEGTQGPLHYRLSDDYLFGRLHLAEQALAPLRAPALQQATENAYRQLFACLASTGYPALIRVWNYLPRINAVEEGIERYRQFNIGRQDAFLAARRSLTDTLPAACALGSVDGGLTIGFLAARQPPIALENPRQVSAYHYPADYGPRSPTFSRATLVPDPVAPLLFISGTASIVGHRSLHPGDVVAQTAETLTNLAAVIAAANDALGRPHFSPDTLDYVVYLRAGADLMRVAAVLDDWLSPATPRRYVEADICRRELLVEIEACGGPGRGTASPVPGASP